MQYTCICKDIYYKIYGDVVKWNLESQHGRRNQGQRWKGSGCGESGERVNPAKSVKSNEQAAPLLHYSFTRTQTCG